MILRLSDVIAGGAVGPGGGAPPVPPALAAVLPVPPVATLNVQPQLQSYRVKKIASRTHEKSQKFEGNV